MSIMVLLTACAETGTSLTLEAQFAFAGTQVADLRLTATVQAARAETTLDFMGTRASSAATRSSFFEETLVATGFPADVLATQRERALGSSPTPLPSVTVAGQLDENLTPTATLAETLTPTPPQVTINAPNTGNSFPPTALVIQATPDLGGLTIGNVLTATGAGNDGCGAGVTSVFQMGVSEIYVIIPAFNITANDHTFAARWQRDGQPVGPVYDFTPEENIDELCVWFFVDETDFAFEPGSYSVTIDVNGGRAAGPIPFIIQ